MNVPELELELEPEAEARRDSQPSKFKIYTLMKIACQSMKIKCTYLLLVCHLLGFFVLIAFKEFNSLN